MVVYKESQELAKKDPKLDEWTGTFRDGRPINPLGAQPENALTGTIFTVNAWRHDALEVPSEFSGLRFWRHTSVAEMHEGEVKVIKPGLLGHEWDEDLDNGFRPPGLVRLSRTTVNNLWMVQDYITNCDSGTATHSLVMYRSSSGSLVFGAGTVQWSWGLDPYRDTETGVPPERANPTNIRVGRDQMGAERDIQQATLNLFMDMGVAANVEDLGESLLELSLSRRIRDTIFIHCKHPELDHDAMLERGDLPASLVSTSHLHHRLPSPTVRTLPHFFLDFLLGNRHSLKQGSHSRSFQNIPTVSVRLPCSDLKFVIKLVSHFLYERIFHQQLLNLHFLHFPFSHLHDLYPVPSHRVHQLLPTLPRHVDAPTRWIYFQDCWSFGPESNFG